MTDHPSHGTGYEDDLTHRFTYHPPDEPLLPETYRLIRDAGLFLALLVEAVTPPSRERSLAVTNIEQAVMWANAGIARRGPATLLTADRLADEVWAAVDHARADFGHNLRGTEDTHTENPQGGSSSYDVDVLRSGLTVIASRGCENSTRGDCWGHGKYADAEYGADRACWPCIAQRVLDGQALPSEPTPEDAGPDRAEASPEDPWSEPSLADVARQARDVGLRVAAAANKFLAGLPGEG